MSKSFGGLRNSEEDWATGWIFWVTEDLLGKGDESFSSRDNTGYPVKKVPAGQRPVIEWSPLGLEFLGTA